MQSEEAAELRRQWKEAGDKPCSHEITEKEYYLGSNTGDRICTTCGFAAIPADFEKLRRDGK
ncbi:MULTISPECIES: hypothetical protein [unclassified Bacillus cereus group]|uniref:hypothetical protein n=1 Tax=unclassified Bacillus cereus group TaxID=2750818 RepID=UPI0011EF5068|nr:MULTISPECIES: hypothetical protein [unclassified Bacillus cereus group]QEL70408.1 hypothetical protein DN399_20870 [Bacillus sp. AR4-2]QEL75687.1 hypothetical protein DN405_20870 [Bacillus sp. SH8-8]